VDDYLWQTGLTRSLYQKIVSLAYEMTKLPLLEQMTSLGIHEIKVRTNMTALGISLTRNGIIKIKHKGDLMTLGHEIAHFIPCIQEMHGGVDETACELFGELWTRAMKDRI